MFVLPGVGFVGGVRTVAMYAHHLTRRGHQVTVVSRKSSSPSMKARVRSLLRRGWTRSARGGPSYLDELGVDHVVVHGDRSIEDRDVPGADVIVATYWLTAEWVSALSPEKGAKVHFIQGDDADNESVPAERVHATWRLPFHRVVCSEWLRELARSRYGVECSLVPNGVDLDHFSSPVRGRQSRPTVGVVYAIEPQKACGVALDAYAMASRRIPGLRLVAFGSVAAVPELPLPRGTEFTWCPAQRHIPEIYAQCDAWLWPSRREGFGLPILEAMACRTPVIAAPAGAAVELLALGGGVLLRESDPTLMADAIVRVCTAPDAEWRTWSTRARETAERHDWSVSTGLLEAVLERAVRDRNVPPAVPGAGGPLWDGR